MTWDTHLGDETKKKDKILEPIIQIIFTPLYILASFVKDKVSICVWIYLWAFYFVPLIYISVFVPGLAFKGFAYHYPDAGKD